MRNIEILAPAGSYESMIGAFNAGADAVYMGGRLFGARAYADNQEEDNLLRAIDYAHLHHKKLYLTVNTLLKDNEIKEKLFDYLLPYYKNGLDAVIVQDLGVLDFISHHFPGLPIHASTQMTVVEGAGARFLKEAGVTRVVTARELNLEEIRAIKDAADVEIESFVHGALCYAFSGQCLLSSMLGGRSGNRGRCAQPCRLPYSLDKDGMILGKNQYYMSLKDLCALDLIPLMVEAGIDSFKIEGRMKKPEYAALISYLYRKYTDMYLKYGEEGFLVSKEDREMLTKLYNRGGQSTGYYQQRNGKSMVSLQKSTYKTDHSLDEQQIREQFLLSELKEKINGTLIIYKDLPAKMAVHYGDLYVECDGSMVVEAASQPLTVQSVLNRMNKTGNTPFEFEQLDIILDDNAYLSVKEQNQLRRDTLAALEQAVLEDFKTDRQVVPAVETQIDQPIETLKMVQKTSTALSVQVMTAEQLKAVVSIAEVDEIYAEADLLDEQQALIVRVRESGKKIIAALPHILRKDTCSRLKAVLTRLQNQQLDGYLIRNIESYCLLKELNLKGLFILDHSVYIFNTYTKKFWQQFKDIDRMTLPLEQNHKELRSLGFEGMELAAYGHLPLMLSAQCLVKTAERCMKNNPAGNYQLIDRYRQKFYIKRNCLDCYNVIYNGQPLLLLDSAAMLRRMGVERIRLMFTVEDDKMTHKIVTEYVNAFIYDRTSDYKPALLTHGHFKRGVE